MVSPGLDRMLLWAEGVAFFASVLMVPVAWARMGTEVGVVAFVAAVLAMSILIHLPAAIGWRSPREVETVGDLVRIVAPLDWPRGGAGARLLMQHRVLEEVREITSRELGVPLEKVKPESEFVKDLGRGEIKHDTLCDIYVKETIQTATGLYSLFLDSCLRAFKPNFPNTVIIRVSQFAD